MFMLIQNLLGDKLNQYLPLCTSNILNSDASRDIHRSASSRRKLLCVIAISIHLAHFCVMIILQNGLHLVVAHVNIWNIHDFIKTLTQFWRHIRTWTVL
jgi:hypothetical protein